MAVEVMTWVWKTQLKPTLKLTLLALADYSNAEGYCYPSISSLVKKSSLTRSSLIKNVQKLCDMQVIEKHKRYTNGTRSSNEYRININLSPESIRMELGRPESIRPESIRPESIRMENLRLSPENGLDSTEPSITNNRTISNTCANERNLNKSAKERKEEFEKFYKKYPRKKDRKRARSAWEKIKPDKNLINKIMIGVKNLNEEVVIKNTPQQYIKLPTSWLNGECWEDEVDLTIQIKPNQRKSTSEKFVDNLTKIMQEANT